MVSYLVDCPRNPVRSLVRALQRGTYSRTLKTRIGYAIQKIVEEELRLAITNGKIPQGIMQFEQKVAGGRVDILLDNALKLDITSLNQVGKATSKYGADAFDILYDTFDDLADIL